MEGFKETRITELKQQNIEEQKNQNLMEPELLSNLLKEEEKHAGDKENSLHSEEVKEAIKEKAR